MTELSSDPSPRPIPTMTIDEITAMVRAKLVESTSWPIKGLVTLRAHNRAYSKHFTYRVQLEGAPDRLVFVKFVQGITHDRTRLEQLVARDNDISHHLEQAFRAHPQFRLPSPIAYSAEHLMLITEFVEGIRLQDKIVRNAKLFPSASTLADLKRDCLRCGQWLQAFQQHSRAFFDSRPAMLGDDFLGVESIERIIMDRIEELHAEALIDAATCQALIDFVTARVAKVSPEILSTSGTHGDFFAGNVLVDQGCVTGIDFVMFRKGSVFFDPTYFVFQLETLQARPDYRGSVIRELCASFLEGYAPDIKKGRIWDLNPLCDLLFVMHTTARLLTLVSVAPASLSRSLYKRYSIAWTRRALFTHIRAKP